MPFLRLYDAAGTRLASLFRQNAAADQLYVQHSGAYHTVNGGSCRSRHGAGLALRLKVAGTASTVEVYLNGTRIYQTTTASLGTAGVATVQIGNDTAAQAFDVVVDDVTHEHHPTGLAGAPPRCRVPRAERRMAPQSRCSGLRCHRPQPRTRAVSV